MIRNQTVLDKQSVVSKVTMNSSYLPDRTYHLGKKYFNALTHLLY